MNVYFISGLGADRRAFQKIQLSNTYVTHYIDWIDPINNETLPEYVQRLTHQIDQTYPFALVGLSFGGVIAIEMGKILNPQKIIIISSISTSSELPKKFQLISSLNLHRIIPAQLYKQPTKLISWFFGAKSNSDRKLLYQIFEDSSANYLKWAVDKLLKWKNKERPNSLFHIHGNNDKLLPLSCVKANIIIPNGGHLMILTHASSISKILDQQLSFS